MTEISLARRYRPLEVRRSSVTFAIVLKSTFSSNQVHIVAVFARGEVFIIHGLERRLTAAARLHLLLQGDAGKTAGNHVPPR